MRKKNEDLRGILLQYAREMITANGPNAINIRQLASRAGVATGTVYNYFQSKEDVLLALTEEYWQTAMADMWKQVDAPYFVDQISQIYFFLRTRIKESGGMLMESLRRVEPVGRERMAAAQGMLRASIMQRVRQDARVAQNAWNDKLTLEQFADFVLMNLLALLRRETDHIDAFLDILNRILDN